MRTTITIPEKNTEDHDFPALYKDTYSDLVVMFVSAKTGMVVIGSGDYSVGAWERDWPDATDEDEWTRLPAGTVVTLEQT